MTEGIPIHVDDVPQESWDVGELRARRKRLGAAAHAARLGVAIIEIEPGARSTPRQQRAQCDDAQHERDGQSDKLGQPLFEPFLHGPNDSDCEQRHGGGRKDGPGKKEQRDGKNGGAYD